MIFYQYFHFFRITSTLLMSVKSPAVLWERWCLNILSLAGRILYLMLASHFPDPEYHFPPNVWAACAPHSWFCAQFFKFLYIITYYHLTPFFALVELHLVNHLTPFLAKPSQIAPTQLFLRVHKIRWWWGPYCSGKPKICWPAAATMVAVAQVSWVLIICAIRWLLLLQSWHFEKSHLSTSR